jgi:hypothetical protein
VRDWRRRSKCLTRNPRDYETENLPKGREADAARALCAGCSVIKECATDAVQPINMTQLLGTEESHDIIYVSGVVRAGIPT